MKSFGNWLWGIVLVVLGLIIGGNAIGIINVDIFFKGWWTLFIIIPSFIGIFNDDDKSGNLIGVLIGVALLLSAQNIISLDLVFKMAVPVILVVIGLSFIFKNIFKSEEHKQIKFITQKSNENNEYVATFAGQEIKLDGEEFKGVTTTAIFGGIKLDLTKAIINENQVVTATALFGGIEIYVPSDVIVKVSSSSMFGGVSDKRRNRQDLDANAKIIYIDAKCTFGGVEIK